MMKPIVLTEFGETMKGTQVCNKTDNSLIEAYHAGVVHDVCNGWFSLRPDSKTHNVLRCDGCGLRIPIPIEIKTYGDLRAWAEKKLGVAV
jgi:hypothetical protein